MQATRQVRLAVCGAHGTGKSTLIGDVASTDADILCIGRGLVRSLLSDGFSFGRDTDLRSMLAYVSQQFAQEEFAAASRVKLVLSDRTLLDMVGYVAANQVLKGCRKWADADIASLRAIARRESWYFDAVVYLPIEFEMERDGVRPDGETYRRTVDRYIRLAAAELSQSPVIEISGEPACRAARLLTAYWRIKDEKASAANGP